MTAIGWNEEDGCVRIALPGDLDLPMAQPLVEGLRLAFGTAPAVVIEASAVERVSTACIQALMVAARHATDGDRGFAIRNASPALVEACADLGLGAWLNEWSGS